MDPQHQGFAQARLWLIRSRLGRVDADLALATFLARVDLRPTDKWDATILEFFLGRRSEDDLFREASDAEPAIESARRTQAAFYAGSVHLLKGDRPRARRMFRTAISNDRRGVSEYLSAAAELRELDRSQR